MLIGLPGSGKSTWIKSHSEGYTILSTDAFIEKQAATQGKTYTEVFADQIGPATLAMEFVADRVRAIPGDVIIDQTNLGSKTRKKKLKPFLEAGYVAEAYIFAPRGMNVHKINSERPDKQIPEHIYASMYRTFLTDAQRLVAKDEGFSYVYHVGEFGE